ncbi:hypothetical protein BVY03_04040 [bacterium K02(2017)]|nr:hypothetical protein BVY03_04040 [bacterium K02(2017)]
MKAIDSSTSKMPEMDNSSMDREDGPSRLPKLDNLEAQTPEAAKAPEKVKVTAGSSQERAIAREKRKMSLGGFKDKNVNTSKKDETGTNSGAATLDAAEKFNKRDAIAEIDRSNRHFKSADKNYDSNTNRLQYKA